MSGEVLFCSTHLKNELKLARRNAVNWADNAWCQMHLLISRLLIL